jgi:hypothetical protein
MGIPYGPSQVYGLSVLASHMQNRQFSLAPQPISAVNYFAIAAVRPDCLAKPVNADAWVRKEVTSSII